MIVSTRPYAMHIVVLYLEVRYSYTHIYTYRKLMICDLHILGHVNLYGEKPVVWKNNKHINISKRFYEIKN